MCCCLLLCSSFVVTQRFSSPHFIFISQIIRILLTHPAVRSFIQVPHSRLRRNSCFPVFEPCSSRAGLSNDFTDCIRLNNSQSRRKCCPFFWKVAYRPNTWHELIVFDDVSWHFGWREDTQFFDKGSNKSWNVCSLLSFTSCLAIRCHENELFNGLWLIKQ